MPTPTYEITTLGCRVNHAETREIEALLRSRGLRPADTDAPDLIVVHTCSVTNVAAAKSRAAVRRALRRLHTHDHADHTVLASHTPAACTAGPQLLVTGCYASTHADEVAALIGDPSAVVGHPDPVRAEDVSGDGRRAGPSPMIERVSQRLDRWLNAGSIQLPIRDQTPPSSRTSPIIPLPRHPADPPPARHVRAELKVQDGCDAHCTFCVIPRIRNTLRSKPIPDAVTEARRLVDLGHREIVITGIFLGAYGHETALRRRQTRPGAHPLADLLDAVAQVAGLQRLRISSLEPGDVTGPLLDAMVGNAPIVVPHLHLPLQSGSDRILRRMNRQYRRDDYLRMIDDVRHALTTPDGLPPAITTDIICGFPGETDADFEDTVDLAREIGSLHMHVFPFSPRQGTAAARWRDLFVPPAVIRARTNHLRRLENDPVTGLAASYRRRFRHRRVRVILEHADRDHPGRMVGRCDHYVRVAVDTDRPRGTIVEAIVVDAESDPMRGRAIDDRIALPVLTST